MAVGGLAGGVGGVVGFDLSSLDGRSHATSARVKGIQDLASSSVVVKLAATMFPGVIKVMPVSTPPRQ
jgi:hypothetical protein